MTLSVSLRVAGRLKQSNQDRVCLDHRKFVTIFAADGRGAPDRSGLIALGDADAVVRLTLTTASRKEPLVFETPNLLVDRYWSLAL